MHWFYNNEKIDSIDKFPQGAIGFIYLITNLDNGKVYYGRKTCCRISKKKLTKKEKLLPENKRKTYKLVNREYKKWQEYTGNSDYLNDDIKSGHKIKKEILRFCFNKTQLTYFEIEYIVCNNALLDENCYNGNLLGKIFPSKLK